MSPVQPRSSATPFFFSQQPNQQIVISSLSRTRPNGSVQSMVTSKRVTQTETKKLAADKEIIVLSSDSESDAETRGPVVFRKMKGKEKEMTEKKKNETLKTSTSIIVDHTSTSGLDRSSVVNDDSQCVNIDSLLNNATVSKFTHKKDVSTYKKNLFDGYASVSNKENSTLYQFVNPVRMFLDMLEDHKTNAGLFDIVVDFTRIYLEIYDEDKRTITDLHDFQTLMVNLGHCLTSKMKDGNYMATSKRFKQVESLAQRTIEVIEKSKVTGEKVTEDYRKPKSLLHRSRKRKVIGGRIQEEKRRKLDDDRGSVDEKREEQGRQREKRLCEEHGIELIQKKCKELVTHPRNSTNNETELVKLLAEPLHDLITAQVAYDLFRNFTPFHLSETVSKCSVGKIFKYNHFERHEYCKQLYCQYMNANMDGTTKVLESWIKIRILETVRVMRSTKVQFGG